MNCEVCKGEGFIVDGEKWSECGTCVGTGELPTPENCKEGTHNHCEDVSHNGDILVVCHDCKTTLGRKTEVYSRVVGYLRPVSGWNKGKKEEFTKRKPYKVEKLYTRGEVGLDST